MAEEVAKEAVEEAVTGGAIEEPTMVPAVVSPTVAPQEQAQAPLTVRGTMPTFEQMRAQANVLVLSGFLPEGLDTAEKALAVMLRGKELGLPPMLAISSLFPVKGKIQADSQTVLALIFRSGQLEDISFEETEEKCTMTMKRKGIPSPFTTSWSKADDKRADLARKSNYKKYPRDMHRAKCILRGGRALFSDITGHLYGWEELSGEAPFGTLPSMTLDAPRLAAGASQLAAGEVIEGEIVEGAESGDREWDWMDFNLAAAELGRNPKEALYFLGCSTVAEANAKFGSPKSAFTALQGALEGDAFKKRRDGLLEVVASVYAPMTMSELEKIGVIKYMDDRMKADPELDADSFDISELFNEEMELFGLEEKSEESEE